MIVNCMYLFIDEQGEAIGFCDHWSSAVFKLHFWLGHRIIETAQIGSNIHEIREIKPEYISFMCQYAP